MQSNVMYITLKGVLCPKIDDLSGEVIGWRNPPADIPNTKPGTFRREIERAIKKAFGIPVPLP